MTLQHPRPMTRFTALAHGVFTAMVLALPLMRMGWDPWSQFLVAGLWSFFIVLGTTLLLLGRSADFSRCGSIFRQVGYLLGLILGTSLLSALLSAYPHSAFSGCLNDVASGAFLLLAMGSSPGHRARYGLALAGAGVLGVLAALLTGGGLSSPWTGPLLNPNLLVALVLLTGPVAVEFGFATGLSTRVRLFWMIASGVLLSGVLFSRSLIGYGTVLLQAVLVGGILLKRTGRIEKKSLFLLGGAALLMGVGILLSRSEWPKLFSGDPDRVTWGITALRIFSAHPMVGVGPGAFGEAYPAFRVSEWGLNSLYAHNFILEFLAERGLWGAGALFLLIGILFVRSWRAVARGAGPGLFAGLVGFCFFNLFHIGFSFPALYWLFFLAAGLAGSSREEAAGSTGRSRGILLLAMGGGLLLGVLSFALFRSNQCLAQARALLAEERWIEAREKVDTGLFWNRWSPELYELRAAVRLRSQEWDGAHADLSRAVALAPTGAGFRTELAELSLERGDADEALRQYEAATRLLPLKASSWERWGDILSGLNRREEADRAYAGALRALTDPRVLGGDANQRSLASQRVEAKRRRRTDDR